ncbi:MULTISPECIES: endonuclease/exonuclease/phosphatase family protein [Actinomyces]|uniref:Endonuclease/exonuclease/phosphatase family protein n=1 Tax=Actinomyces respiraculi TaxID=2744574 RepID=A0A7T0LKK9_9ACTO|nr:MULTISPECIES: endonuclease/exonuclease/phosphatase family protein [Actinomyces]QPL05156.1 endonuclease/exonuclease/phosphatase family protein [Actinomyces respiraculi]
MIRVLTLNLQHAQPGAGAALDPMTAPLAGADIRDVGAAREVLAALADQLRALAPDVIALQEVDLGQARSGRIDQVTELARHLGWTHHRFAAAYAGPVAGLRRRPRRSALDSPADDVLGALRDSAGLPPAGFGNALLSRLPVSSWHVRRLGRGPALVTRRGERPAWDPRSYTIHTSTARVMIAATLTADGALGDAAPGTTDSDLAVGSTHLATRSDVATTQLVDAWAALTSLPGHHLLAGDFNLRADALTRLGTARALGAGATFPAVGPHHRIDHLLTDPWPLGPDGLPLAPGACPQPTPLHATAWGVRSLVVSDHAATWVDLEPVSADG